MFRSLLCLLGFELSVLSGLLGSGLGLGSLVQVEGSVLVSNGEDEVLLAQILNESSGDGPTDLELFAKDCSGDAEDLWDLLDHSLVLLLVEEHGVVECLLDLDLGP